MKKLYQVLFLLCFVFSMTCILEINVHAEDTAPVAMQLDTDYTITPTQEGENYQYFSFTAKKDGRYILSLNENIYSTRLDFLNSYNQEWSSYAYFSEIQNTYRFYMSKGETRQLRMVTEVDNTSSITSYTIKIQSAVQVDLANSTPINEEEETTLSVPYGESYTSYTFIPQKSTRYLIEFDDNSIDSSVETIYDLTNDNYIWSSELAHKALYNLKEGTEYLITIKTNNWNEETTPLSFQIKNALPALKEEATTIVEGSTYTVDFDTNSEHSAFLFTPLSDTRYGFYFEHSDSLSINGEVFDITDGEFSESMNYISTNKLSDTLSASDAFLYKAGRTYLIHISSYNPTYYDEENPPSSHYEFNLLDELQLSLKQSISTTLDQVHNIQITQYQGPSRILFSFTPDHSATYTFTSETNGLISNINYFDITDGSLEYISYGVQNFLQKDRQYLIAVYFNVWNDISSGTYKITCVEDSTPTSLNQIHDIEIVQKQGPYHVYYTFTPDHDDIYDFYSEKANLINTVYCYDITDGSLENVSFNPDIPGYLRSGRTYLIEVNLNCNRTESGTYQIQWIENSSTINLNETQNIEITKNIGPHWVYFYFTPEYTDYYTFNSTQTGLISFIEYYEMIDGNPDWIDFTKASGATLLESGKTYIIQVVFNHKKLTETTGTYPITLISKTESYKAGAQEIELNTEYEVYIKSYNDTQEFVFTPAEDGDYKFFSYSYKNNPKATLYCLGENGQGVVSTHYNNDGGTKRNFKIIQHLEAGKTYLFVCDSISRTDSYRYMLVKYSEEYEKGFAYSDSNASVAFGDEYYDEFSQQVSDKTGSSTLAETLKESWTKFWGGFWHGAFGNSSGNASGNASGNSSGNATGNNAGDEGNATGHGLLTSWSNFWSDLWTSLVTQPAKEQAEANASGNASGNASRNANAIVTTLKQSIIAHLTKSELGETFSAALDNLKTRFWTSFWNNASDTLTGDTTPKFTWDDSECTVTYGDTTITDVTITSAVISAPTCTATGKTKYTATVVIEGKTYTDDHEVTTTATGHDYVDHAAKAPTCTEPGWDAYETCSKCDYTTYKEIPASGHDKVTHEAKAPTCTEVGWNAYETCSKCDYTTYNEIPASGHDKGTHEAKAPTCTEPGWDAYQTCSRCDYTTYKEILATGHNWNDGTLDGDKIIYSCQNEGCTSTLESKADVINDIIDHATTVVDTLKDNNEDLTDQEKSTVVQTVNQVIGKIDTASDVKDNIGMEAVASMDELLIKAQDTVTSSTSNATYKSSGQQEDIEIQGAAFTAQKYVSGLNDAEKNDGSTYNTVVNINEAASPADSVPDFEETDCVLDISLDIVKTTDNGTTAVVDSDIQPAAPIRMTIPVPDEYYGSAFKLYHYKDGKKEEIPFELSSDGKTMTFVVTSLSPYALQGLPTFEWDNEKCTSLVRGAKTETQPTVTLTKKINPTCAKAGKLVYTASINYRDDPYEDTNEITIPATGQHSWDQGVQNGNVIVHTCTVCKQTKTTAAPVTAPTDAKVSSINITGLSHYVAAGKKMKLTATALPENATNKSVVWSSSNTKVATVNQSGVVTVLKKTGGKSVVITATAADGTGAKQTFKITSKKGVVTKVAISGKKILSVSKSMKLKASIKATAGAYKKVKWTSSNPAYATVSSKGVVKALKAGKGKTVKITAMATDGSGKKATIKIKIK